MDKNRPGKDPLLINSSRALQIGSNRPKQLERMNKNRSAVTSFPHWAQTISQYKRDARHMLHLIGDVIALETAYSRPVLSMKHDVSRGFPSLRHEEAILVLHAQGESGSTLAMTDAMGLNFKIKIRVGPGQYTDAYHLRLGTPQGTVRSPDKFSAATRRIIEALQTAGIGITVLADEDYEGSDEEESEEAASIFCGVVVFMDDAILLVRDAEEAEKATQIIIQVGVDMGLLWDLGEKMDVALHDPIRPGPQALLKIDFTPEAEPGTGRVAPAAAYHGEHPVNRERLEVLGFEFGVHGLQRRIAPSAIRRRPDGPGPTKRLHDVDVLPAATRLPGVMGMDAPRPTDSHLCMGGSTPCRRGHD